MVHTRIVDAGFRGDVGERAVAVVLQQVIGTEAGDVKIFEAVVVVIADGARPCPNRCRSRRPSRRRR